ncbi:glycine-rich domain-containing protein [Actinomadura macrotermitis]|uniref:Uncharacterized protein n=1 Tax=Actinomadura macrotermitis TaxID=2585200 RepID=A0A7K0BUF1_9ACTN|nr:hypothetical protein [Actinomadura macrotermitis]MQY04757.1 hypothetical protein [Actinomadura macrotermitis]
MTVTAQRPMEVGVTADPRSLISPELLARLAGRIASEQICTEQHAEQVMLQALGFLKACALNPGAGLAPSEAVDIGWHTFILHTREYADFCQRVAGRFIHHTPADPGESPHQAEAIGSTVAAMRAAGIEVDTALWVPVSKCSQCYAGCANDPKAAGA